MRRAKRRNGAAYQHRRRRSLTGAHAEITRGRAWSTNALTACSLGIRSQDSPPSHSPIALRCPGNGREPPMGTVINPQRDLMQDVGPEVSTTSQLSSPVPVAHTRGMGEVREQDNPSDLFPKMEATWFQRFQRTFYLFIKRGRKGRDHNLSTLRRAPLSVVSERLLRRK
jgi:hypothetical protein